MWPLRTVESGNISYNIFCFASSIYVHYVCWILHYHIPVWGHYQNGPDTPIPLIRACGHLRGWKQTLFEITYSHGAITQNGPDTPMPLIRACGHHRGWMLLHKTTLHKNHIPAWGHCIEWTRHTHATYSIRACGHRRGCKAVQNRTTYRHGAIT